MTSQLGYGQPMEGMAQTAFIVPGLQATTGCEIDFIELLPTTPCKDETFTRFREASRDWDGSDPVRPFG